MDREIQSVTVAKKDLTNDERMQFERQFDANRKSPAAALLLGLLFGPVGADRFYLGDTGLGFGKLALFIGRWATANPIVEFFVLGVLCVWVAVDWFLIMNAARTKNIQLSNTIRSNLMQLRQKGR